MATAAVDNRMESTYMDLSERAISNAVGLPVGEQYWVAIVGGPGAGKSTLAEGVQRCTAARGVSSVVIPMDGFHFSRAELKRLDPPEAATLLPRRGSPPTFDAESLVEELKAARADRTRSLPTYSRKLSDPVCGGVELRPEHRIVFVEGNYLLIGALRANGDLLTDAERTEVARWAPLLELFDDTWFVAPPGGVTEQRRRLVTRHLGTWSEAKTLAWSAASAAEGAEKRTDFNDVPNAHFVEQCRGFADVAVSSI